MVILGIDIGGTSTKVVSARADGEATLEVLAVARSVSYRKPTVRELTAAAAGAMAQLLGTSDLLTAAAMDGTLRLGVCVPGIVDPETGVVTRSVNLPNLVGHSITDLLRGVVTKAVKGTPAGQMPVVLVSDALATALDWHHGHAGEQKGRTLCVVLGTGVGAAVLDDGVPLTVTGKSAGHIGQMDVSLSDEQPVPVGPDGGEGSLEAYIGLPALLAAYGPKVREAAVKWDGTEPPVRALVRAIRIGIAMYRPERVVLMGGVGLLLRPLLPRIDAAVHLRLTNLAKPNWKLLVADDDLHAARGAARAAVEG